MARVGCMDDFFFQDGRLPGGGGSDLFECQVGAMALFCSTYLRNPKELQRAVLSSLCLLYEIGHFG